MKPPYELYKNTNLWEILENTISELAENGDIELTTNIEYIVGYTCKKISNEKYDKNIGHME